MRKGMAVYRCGSCGKRIATYGQMEEHCPKQSDLTASHNVPIEALFDPSFGYGKSKKG